MSAKLRLGVNIDHVATVRNARGGARPDPVRAALLAIQAGADGITAHLREDRRHIRDADIARLKAEISKPLNFEMAVTEEMLAIAARTRPHACCLVPEKREERTTEGGLDVLGQKAALIPAIATLKAAGSRISLFIEPDEAPIRLSKELGADIVELHTGTWCHAVEAGDAAKAEAEFQRLKAGAAFGPPSGLKCMRATASISQRPRSSRPCRNSWNSTSGISSSARRSSSACPRRSARCGRDGSRRGEARMIIGIGSDLCRIDRIEETLNRFGERFINRVFTETERARSERRAERVASYAKRFAAKEAMSKALGTGLRMGIAWRDMGVVNEPSGRPTMVLVGKAAERLKAMTPPGHRAVIHLTITDDDPYALAVVVIEALPQTG